jgi:hypothetical protein
VSHSQTTTKQGGYMQGKRTAISIVLTSVLSLLFLGTVQAQPPMGFIPGADDYLCYKTTGESVNAVVRLRDQFDGLGEIESNQDGEPRIRRIREAQWHCNPVGKRILAGPNAGFVQPINHPQLHYVCHNIDPNDVKSPQVTVNVDHEFGEENLDVEQEAFLCSPAFKQIIGGAGD